MQRKRAKPLKRIRRKRKATVPQPIREAVMRRSGGICVRPGCERPAIHVHHWLDESLWPELAKVEANLSGTCPWCNWDHHFKPYGRLPFSAIPGCTLRLAAKLGPRAQLHLDRFYPVEEEA
jgi:hypothetical protein